MTPSLSMDFTKPAAFALMGGSGSGKSALAMALLAAGLPISLISVDSVMVYQGFDIGSAKPSREALSRYPHALVDIAKPEESYTVSRFFEDALTAAEKSFQGGKIPLFVGGTSLYFYALLEGLHPLVKTDEAALYQARTLLEKEGADALRARLFSAGDEAPPSDRQRLLRSYALFLATGKPLSRHLQTQQKRTAPFQIHWVWHSPKARRSLDSAIFTRAKAMVESGLREEADALLCALPPFLRESGELPPAFQSIGYRECFAMKDLSDAALSKVIAKHTEGLVKRQYTWSKRFPFALCLDSEAPLEARVQKMSDFLSTPLQRK